MLLRGGGNIYVIILICTRIGIYEAEILSSTITCTFFAVLFEV